MPTPEARERRAEAELRRHMAGEYASDAEDKAVASFRTAVRAALVAEMQAEPSVPSGEAVACVKRLAYWANLWAEQGSDETLTRDIVDGDERVALASLYAAPPQERVSEARIGIESHLGLHQVVELRYLVDCFEAVLLTQDGDKLVARGTGTNVADAMEQLLAALAPSRRAPSGDGGGRDA